MPVIISVVGLHCHSYLFFSLPALSQCNPATEIITGTHSLQYDREVEYCLLDGGEGVEYTVVGFVEIAAILIVISSKRCRLSEDAVIQPKMN